MYTLFLTEEDVGNVVKSKGRLTMMKIRNRELNSLDEWCAIWRFMLFAVVFEYGAAVASRQLIK